MSPPSQPFADVVQQAVPKVSGSIQRQDMQQLVSGQGALRPPGGPDVAMIFHQVPPGPTFPSSFGFPQIVPSAAPVIPPLNPQPSDQFAGWRALRPPVPPAPRAPSDVPLGQFVPGAPATANNGSTRGRMQKNGKWQQGSRRSRSFNGQLPPRQSFGPPSHFGNGDFQQRRKRGRHNGRSSQTGGRSKGDSRAGGVCVQVNCNFTFLDADEAHNRMTDVGNKAAQQIMEQLKEQAKEGHGLAAQMLHQEGASFKIYINVCKDNTVADNIRQGGQHRVNVRPKTGKKFDCSQSIYESKCLPHQVQHFICTPSTVQQGCAGSLVQREAPETEAEQLVLEIAEEQTTREQWVSMLRTQLPTKAVFSEDYLKQQDLKTIQALCVSNGLLTSTAPCLDLSKIEMIEMLTEKFNEQRTGSYCCCTGPPDAAPASSTVDHTAGQHVDYFQLPCRHLLCQRCLGEAVRFDRLQDGVRVGCPLCTQDDVMSSPSLSFN